MRRMSRDICILILVIVICGAGTGRADSAIVKPDPGEKIIGMYVHQHWPYNHPYAARTWTLQDWRGYADGLKRLGYNTLLIWPMLETMPNPLTPSDRSNVQKIRRVIDMAHHELGMRVHIIICPNVGADNQIARQANFEKRHFFYCDTRVNPADSEAVRRMMAWRERLLRPLSWVDGLVIIDSDPGGYPGSNNQQFVNLLGEHRRLLDRLRPGIELTYWMHAGWPAYCRFYETGNFAVGSPEEFQDALVRLNKLNPEPWGLANGLRYAQQIGLESRVVSYNYGTIEGEPTFPLTNFGGDGAYNSGKDSAPRGVIGNAQTHCLQLPNTFAFARGARGLTLTEADYVQFANDLLPGHGRSIVDGWMTLSGDDPRPMYAIAHSLKKLSQSRLRMGPLKGLLFGDPHRFLMDIVMQLRMKAAYLQFIGDSTDGGDVRGSFPAFVRAAETWQHTHGYECAWGWPGLGEALHALQSPEIDGVLDTKIEGSTAFERVHDSLRKMETYTSRLLAAMKAALPEMEKRAPAIQKVSITSDGEIISLSGGNWTGDEFTRGGLDEGLSGDRSALVVAAASSEGFQPIASMPVDLQRDYSTEPKVALNIGYRRNSLQADEGIIYWDGKQIVVCSPKSQSEGLVVLSAVISTSEFSLKAGKHQIKIEARNKTAVLPGFFEVDAISIVRAQGR